MLMLIYNGKYFTRKSELCMKVNFIEYLKFSLGFLTFQFYFMLVASNCCLKFPVILKNSQKFLKIPRNFWQSFQIYSLSGKVIGTLSWNSQEFQALLVINLEFLGMSGNLQVFRTRVTVTVGNSQEFPVRIYRENSYLLFLGIPKSISQETLLFQGLGTKRATVKMDY